MLTRVQDLKSVDASGTKAKGGMEAVPEAGLPPPVGEGLTGTTGTTKGECRSFPCCAASNPLCGVRAGPGSCSAAALIPKYHCVTHCGNVITEAVMHG